MEDQEYAATSLADYIDPKDFGSRVDHRLTTPQPHTEHESLEPNVLARHKSPQTVHVQSMLQDLDEEARTRYDHFVNYATELLGELPLERVTRFVDNVITIVQESEHAKRDSAEMKHRLQQVLPVQHANSYRWRGMPLSEDEVDALCGLANGVLHPHKDRLPGLSIVDDDPTDIATSESSTCHVHYSPLESASPVISPTTLPSFVERNAEDPANDRIEYDSAFTP